ncbi:MAG: ribosome silencing factor [Desulfovibrio sp.]|jgi:ribosome-associated protein|nr:ribosome silencing factor [Desulfovibrio sp.]
MSDEPKRFSKASTLEKAAVMVDLLAEKKAVDIVALDLAEENALCEAVIIAGSTSARHGQGLAETLLLAARERNFEYLHMEGHALARWILLDFNDVVVHILQSESRELFRLEEMWPKAGVLAEAGRRPGPDNGVCPA